MKHPNFFISNLQMEWKVFSYEIPHNIFLLGTKPRDMASILLVAFSHITTKHEL